jgi:antitoxin VapB
MSLNIKDRDAHRLAEELAKLTGESMTTAVTIAVRERFDRVRQELLFKRRRFRANRYQVGRTMIELASQLAFLVARCRRATAIYETNPLGPSTRNHHSAQAIMRISVSCDSRILRPRESRFYESGY